MSLPSFPAGGPSQDETPILVDFPTPGGAGDHLPIWLLACCGAFTAVATGVSIMSITLQLKNYRKPALQRAVVRIMVMVPLYAISSLIAIFSLEAAFFIDAVRDLYEAFVIYTFFQLLITYLGGERSLLIILHGRPPIPHPFPFNIFLSPMDVSDPWTLLNLKRGVLQYVQIKPLLVVATIILKATGTYREGRFASDSGYTYISIIYNTSICLSLYCLAMFWVCVANDLKPFRPVPKFLCVKGILFFSFWQSIGISLLVAVKAIKKVGPYTDAEHMSLALVDSLICFEMPIFAIAHQYAFQASDYIDDSLRYAARLPFIYALRDAFGMKDVWQDTKDTFKGQGVSYQAYEPAEGGLHHGAGRQRRIRAGLRYSKGGKAKYWVPMPGDEARSKGERGPLSSIKRRVDERLAAREGYAPLLPKQASQVVREDPDNRGHHQNQYHANYSKGYGGADNNGQGGDIYYGDNDDSSSDESDAPSLEFSDIEDEEDKLYERARKIGYAGFPNVDVSKEQRRKKLREEEDGILRGKWTRTSSRDGSMNRQQGRDRAKSGSSVNGGGKGKGKGKGRDRGGSRVYGAWAEGDSHNDGQRPHRENGSALHPDDAWEYNGENERPDAWHANDNAESEAAQLRWTNQRKRDEQGLRPPITSSRSGASQTSSRAPSRRSQASRSKSPFALKDSDSESQPDLDEPVSPAASDKPLPSDAVDLVVEDPEAREQARMHERRKGEPQTNAPRHVFRAARSRSDVRVPLIQEVYSPNVEDVVKHSEAMEAPHGPLEDTLAHLKSPVHPEGGGMATVSTPTLYDREENPWA